MSSRLQKPPFTDRQLLIFWDILFLKSLHANWTFCKSSFKTRHVPVQDQYTPLKNKFTSPFSVKQTARRRRNSTEFLKFLFWVFLRTGRTRINGTIGKFFREPRPWNSSVQCCISFACVGGMTSMISLFRSKQPFEPNLSKFGFFSKNTNRCAAITSYSKLLGWQGTFWR